MPAITIFISRNWKIDGNTKTTCRAGGFVIFILSFIIHHSETGFLSCGVVFVD